MEEIDQQGLLDMFSGYSKGERVILGHFGTVQTLLALIYNTPVTVHLENQTYRNDNEIIRKVHLKAGDRVLCMAASQIFRDRNSPAVILDIVAGGLGLGQIIYKHNIPSKRHLLKVERDVQTFTRQYVIEGPELYLEISEVFMRKPFMDIGWV